MSPDVILITESWTRDDVGDAEIALKGYNIIQKDRRDRTGGGCLLFVKKHLNVTVIEDLTDTPLAEAIWCKLVIGNRVQVVGLCYRPDSSSSPEGNDLICELV